MTDTHFIMAKQTNCIRYCYQCSLGEAYGSESSRYLDENGNGLLMLVACHNGTNRALGKACDSFEERDSVDPRLLTWDIVERVHGRKMR